MVLLKEVLDPQQEVLSRMLTKQQELHDKRVSDYLESGRSSTDELLSLDIDDFVLVNCPKSSKPGYSSTGPHRVTAVAGRDCSTVVQSVVDESTKVKVKASRLTRLKYDQRCGLTPTQVQAEDRHHAEVTEAGDWDSPEGGSKPRAEEGQRRSLRPLVRFATGSQWMSWEESKDLKALDTLLDSTDMPGAVAARLRTGERQRKTGGPVPSVVWRENLDSALTRKEDGTTSEAMDSAGGTSSVKAGGPREQAERVREPTTKPRAVPERGKKSQPVSYPPVVCREKDSPEDAALGKRWEHPRRTCGPRAPAACTGTLKELEDSGATEEAPVEEDQLEWSTPTSMVVDRFTGSDKGERVPVYRLRFDSRAASSRRVPEQPPQIQVEEVPSRPAGRGHQSIVDVPKALFLVEVEKESRKYSSLTHPQSGKRHWSRGVVVGGTSSPTHLQTSVQRVPRQDLPYMGDLAIGDLLLDQHLSHLESVFQQCLDSGTSLGPKRCSPSTQSLEVLGRATGTGYRKVDGETVSRVKNYAKPTTVKQLVAFSGLVNWTRDYLPGTGEKAAPLYDLARAEGPEGREEPSTKSRYRYLLRTKVQWTPELESVLYEARDYCADPVGLYYTDCSRPTCASTGAPPRGRGGTLHQLDDSSQKRTCGTKSGSWSKTQAKWPTVEQEAYAAYRTTTDLECCPVGRPPTLPTDSTSLTYLKESPSRKVQRWRLALQMFSFTSSRTAGERSSEADDLSRVLGPGQSVTE